MDQLDDYEHYDYLLEEPLAELGWEVSEVSWRNRGIEWDRFDAVVIRTTWDYHHDHRAFLNVLEEIEQSTARLENPLHLIRWNIDKRYLGDLGESGIHIVPTEWGAEKEDISETRLQDCFRRFETDEIILKPTISAGADNTFRLSPEAVSHKIDQLKITFNPRAFMIQPLMGRIIDEGEYSVIYFGRDYSHTILKTPVEGDFRVQEEHGGILKKVQPEPGLKAMADHIVESISSTPLYSRVDVVRDGDRFALMELELIEPSLYFNMDPQSPSRFARFFDRWMENRLG